MAAARATSVLIVHPPVSVSPDFIDYPYFADLGAVQLAAVLEKHAQVALVDAYALPGSTLEWRPDGRAHLGASVAETLAAIERALPADRIVVAYTPFHRPPNRDDVLGALLAGIRARTDVPIVLADCYQSGQHYVEADEAVLQAYPEAWAWVKYEAEETLPELLASDGIEGVIGGTPPEKLDDLPFPAWHRIDLDAYFRFHARVVANLGRGDWPFPIDGRTLPMVTSRGCPFVCVHCSSNPGRAPGEPKTQRRYSPDRLRAYLRMLARDHGATRVEVLDELINVNERHFDTFLDEVAALGLKFDCPNGMRADYLEPEHLRKMRGLVKTVSVSAESGVQRVVTEVVKKRLDLAAITRAAESAHAAGVPLMIHFMIGLPGETAQEINGTLSYAMDLWERFGAWPAVQYATPLPGTQLAAGKLLPVVSDWGPYFQREPFTDSGTRSLTPLTLSLDPPRSGERLSDLRSAQENLSAGRSTSEASLRSGAGTALSSPRSEGERFGEGSANAPPVPAPTVSPDLLRKFKHTFDSRLHHSQGPKKVIMNVTYLCNNHCTFCAVGTRTQVHGHPTRQREHLLTFRQQGVEMVDFDGGEPTLNPELIPLVRYAREIGYRRINVTTNGRLAFYEDFAKKLVRSGLTTLLFSVHGPDAQSHAAQVGVAEAFDQTTGGIRNALKFAPPGVELGMNITITKGNFAKLEAVTQLAWDLGLRWLNIQFLTPFGRATSWVAPDTQAAADIATGVIDRWKDRMKFQVINLPFCFMPNHQDFMMGDLAKLERHMIFVNNEDVNLAEYLAERRVRKPVCESCPHAVFCGGFYELEKVPEPPWLIADGEIDRPMQVRETVKLGLPARVTF
jgi:MoaA/NifB/PqqE/SkfB family radical SAM enzyme